VTWKSERSSARAPVAVVTGASAGVGKKKNKPYKNYKLTLGKK